MPMSCSGWKVGQVPSCAPRTRTCRSLWKDRLRSSPSERLSSTSLASTESWTDSRLAKRDCLVQDPGIGSRYTLVPRDQAGGGAALWVGSGRQLAVARPLDRLMREGAWWTSLERSGTVSYTHLRAHETKAN